MLRANHNDKQYLNEYWDKTISNYLFDANGEITLPQHPEPLSGS